MALEGGGHVRTTASTCHEVMGDGGVPCGFPSRGVCVRDGVGERESRAREAWSHSASAPTAAASGLLPNRPMANHLPPRAWVAVAESASRNGQASEQMPLAKKPSG